MLAYLKSKPVFLSKHLLLSRILHSPQLNIWYLLFSIIPQPPMYKIIQLFSALPILIINNYHCYCLAVRVVTFLKICMSNNSWPVSENDRHEREGSKWLRIYPGGVSTDLKQTDFHQVWLLENNIKGKKGHTVLV